MDIPENPRVRRFKFLTEAEFHALRADEKMAYLRAALKERERDAGSDRPGARGNGEPPGA